MTNPDVGTPPRVPNVFAGLLQAPAHLAAALAGALTKRSSGSCSAGCCEIPPPCWEPRPAGNCCIQLTPGSSATIRVHVSNCGWNRQVVGITGLGRLAGWLTIQPTTFILGPQERATVLVIVRAPVAVRQGQSLSGPLLVRGCVDHFARVDVSITDCMSQSCCDVFVNDCPDNIHHWYDHFYCPRPCRTLTQVPGR